MYDSNGNCIGWTRRENIGVIIDISDNEVKVFNKNNPDDRKYGGKDYRYYSLNREDFEKWCEQGLYVLR